MRRLRYHAGRALGNRFAPPRASPRVLIWGRIPHHKESAPMDYRFTDKEESFRTEVRQFLRSELPEDWDFAPLQTRAVKDGDDYIINGTKIWSSNAHKANWCFFLARTDTEAPKHKGISYFITPMDAPGISVRPLVNMADEHVFNEIIFDNVRVPVKYLVGEENRGWYIGMTTLDFERSNISTAAQYRRTFEQLVDYVKNGTNGS